MNRAQKRMAAKTNRHKFNRSRAIYTTNFQLEHESFDTIERLFQQIRNGELRYDRKDGWIIMGLSGEDLHILSAIEGWMLYWRTLTEEQSIQYDDSAMRRLAKSLEYEKPMNMAEVEAAYAVLEQQRRIYRALPKSITTLVSKQVQQQIRVESEIRSLLGAAA
jgi:hypothetical protein